MTAGKWIKLSDQAPENGVCVLVAIRIDYTNGTHRYDIDFAKRNYNDWGHVRTPTHWMPVPQDPDDDQ